MKLVPWFDYKARNLAEQLKFTLKVGKVIHVSIAPKWTKTWFSLMGIEYIGLRGGEEANYLVFLNRHMDKFHETYLAE